MEHTTDKLTAIRSCARRLRLSSLTMNAAEELVKAQTSSPSYDDFLLNILNTEVEGREARQKVLRYKAARLPMDHDLNRYDFSTYKGLSLTQLNQLRELHWVEAGYNIMLAGPSGVGKTYVASGLCADAIEHGYKAYFRTMESIMNTLKTRDATPYARAEYRNLCSAQLIVIDDLMNIIVSREEGNILFAWINHQPVACRMGHDSQRRGAGYSHTRPLALQMRTHPALRAQLQNGKPKDNLQQYRTKQ